jgi:hypothetical protein
MVYPRTVVLGLLACVAAWGVGCGSNSMSVGNADGAAGGSTPDPNGNAPGSRTGMRPSDMNGGSGGAAGSGGAGGVGGAGGAGGAGGRPALPPDASAPPDGPRPLDAAPDLSARPEAGAEAPPPPSDAAPPRPDTGPVTTSLLGTRWKVTDTGAEGNSFIWEFLAGGVMRYTYLTGPLANNVYTNATWTQMGNGVTIVYNTSQPAYSTRVGTFEGNSISGTASNVMGLHWTWSGVRQ